jgi:hypothetical protein
MPTLIGDLRLGRRFTLAGNVGAILRGENTLYDKTGTLLLRLHHQLTYGLGAALRIHKYIGASVEAVGTVPLTGAPDTPPLPGANMPPIAQAPQLDLCGTLFAFPTPGVRLGLGGGGGLLAGPLRDSGRAFLSVAWSPGPRAGGLP